MKIMMRLALLLLAASCTQAPGSRPPAPGYDGELPSLEARRSLRALEGACLAVPGGEIPAGEYRIGTFAVLPNPITAKSGGVTIATTGAGGAGEVRAFLPLLRDADVADLQRRVVGFVSAELALAGSEEVSSAYARALGG